MTVFPYAVMGSTQSSMRKTEKIDIDEIREKNEVVDNALSMLKRDFVGIDSQIDEIIGNVRAWYLFPELQEHPLVINLWGLTGVGKTSLVRALARYLGVERDLVYFNFAQINEMSSYSVEEEIEESLENDAPNRIFVYDEFQYAATIDENGERVESKSMLKPFWELMDTGILRKRMDRKSISGIRNLLRALEMIMSRCDITLKDGEWVNHDDCLSYFTTDEIRQFHSLLNFPIRKYIGEESQVNDGKMGRDVPYGLLGIYGEDTYVNETIFVEKDDNFIIPRKELIKVLELYSKCGFKICDDFNAVKTIKGMGMDELMAFLYKVEASVSKGYDLVFNQSVIFVIGNIDDVYQMILDASPDMSPDRLNRLSGKISIVDIKESLGKMFRNEQVARLGNIHVIYPAFPSRTFKGIISKELEKYASVALDHYGYHVGFEKSIMDAIYKEGVFPAQGTRPLFSTIHEMVKSKLPLVMSRLIEEGISDKAHTLTYGFRRGKVTVSISGEDGKVLADHTFNGPSRLEMLRKNTRDDEQALVAVHESGHFVMSVYLSGGKLPNRIYSRCVNRNAGGFMIDSHEYGIMSSTDVLNEIMVLLSGHIAEKIIFGENNVSNGSENDLKRATELASRYVRRWGMSRFSHVTTYMDDIISSSSGDMVNERDQDYINSEIKATINRCELEACGVLSSQGWLEMLKESARYLSTHPRMSRAKMAALYGKVPDGIKRKRAGNHYREIVERL